MVMVVMNAQRHRLAFVLLGTRNIGWVRAVPHGPLIAISHSIAYNRGVQVPVDHG